MKRDPHQRQQSMLELKRDLQDWLPRKHSIANLASQKISEAQTDSEWQAIHQHCEQAILLWPDNQEAKSTRRTSFNTHCKLVLKRGDYAYAAVLARRLGDQPLIKSIEHKIERRRWKRRAITAGSIAAITALSLSIFWLLHITSLQQSSWELERAWSFDENIRDTSGLKVTTRSYDNDVSEKH